MHLVLAISILSIIIFNPVIAGGAGGARTPANVSAPKRTPQSRMHQNTFFLQVDPNNTVTRCAGNGYMKSTCYVYPSQWWKAWSYVGPYTPGRTKQVSALLKIVPLDPNEEGYAEIAFAWTTPAWSNLYSDKPPLPGIITDENIENRFIARIPFRTVHLQIGCEPEYISYRHQIQQHSPEWLAIAVRGFNFKVLTGRMMYETEPRQTMMGQLDEARIREIVLQVIRENPEFIQNVLDDHARAKRIEDQRRQLEISFKNRITDIQVGSSPTRGPEDADITIFAFQDFECPYSQRGAATLEPLLKEYAGKARIVFKNRPQTFHKQAAAAAKAALAAHKQGRFWEYHDLLFKNYRALGENIFVKLAKELNLDIERFNADRKSKTIEQQLSADIAEAQKHNFRGTPTFVMNGVVVAGAQSRPYFENVIKRLLEN
jgi:protein-disulfide isomerase